MGTRAADGGAGRYAAVVETPLPDGVRLGLTLRDGRLHGIDFLRAGEPLRPPADPTAREAVRQLEAYFGDPRVVFRFPLAPAPTAFQQSVRAALCAIPPGRTRTYGQVARDLGSAPRAVGGGCRANPVPLMVPCHRVLAAGDRGGFMGQRQGPAIAIKRWLLRHEGLDTD